MDLRNVFKVYFPEWTCAFFENAFIKNICSSLQLSLKLLFLKLNSNLPTAIAKIIVATGSPKYIPRRILLCVWMALSGPDVFLHVLIEQKHWNTTFEVISIVTL